MLGLPSIDANVSTSVSLGKGQASVTPEASLKISGSDKLIYKVLFFLNYPILSLQKLAKFMTIIFKMSTLRFRKFDAELWFKPAYDSKI